jgi:hypothetical protein
MNKITAGLSAIITTLWKILRNFFPRDRAPQITKPIQPTRVEDNTTEPVRISNSRVLLIIYDPIMEPITRQKLSHTKGWYSIDSLLTNFISDIHETSYGLLRFHIVERIEINEFPQKVDGFRYDPSSYMEVLRGTAPHQPEGVDYQSILTSFNIRQRVDDLQIDEVWIFAFPHAGFYESIMVGCDAYWCNAPPLKGNAVSKRRFIIMGFSFERGSGEMLEAFGHRAESMLSTLWEHTKGEGNLFQRFSRYDRLAPGKAEVGTIHFAPNSEKDYDWGNQTFVPSRCEDWENFPAFENIIRKVNASEWGNGDIRLHHKWWLKHLPHVAGRLSGVANNWWQYIADPNLTIL